MILSETTIQYTGFLSLSGEDVSETGLRIYRIGLFHVTVTGAHHSISGSVNADTESVSEAVQSSPKKQEIQRQQR